jgi:rhamnulokinase
MSRHLAFDLGAGSGRAILGDVTPSAFDIREIHRFTYAPSHHDGLLRWDIKRLFDGLRDAIDFIETTDADAGLSSVGVDSWGVDYGLLDDGGHLVESPVCYRDSRTDGVMEDVFSIVPRNEIFRRTGIQFIQLNTLYQLVAHVRAGLPREARKLLLIPDLCHNFLCGSASTEITNASTTQLLNTTSGRWDEELFSRLKLPLDIMPPVVPTGTPLGMLQPALRGGIEVPVVAPATHDTGSAVLGTPLRPGWAYISSGTWSLVGVERIVACTSDDALAANFTNEVGAFGRVRFLKNLMGLWLLESCRREWPSHSLDTLLAEASSLGPPQDVIFPDAARFFNPPSMTREITAALTERGRPAPATPAAFAKVILDSLALRYASVLDTIEYLTGESIAGVHIVGGGSLNAYLNQAAANATGRPVLAGPVEATAIGNVMAQAIAAGSLESIEDGRRALAGRLQLRQFDPQRSEAWGEARGRYAALEARG